MAAAVGAVRMSRRAVEDSLDQLFSSASAPALPRRSCLVSV